MHDIVCDTHLIDTRKKCANRQAGNAEWGLGMRLYLHCMVQTFSICSTGHNLCEFLLETGVALLFLLWFVSDSLPVQPSAQGDDALDRSLPTPQ